MSGFIGAIKSGVELMKRGDDDSYDRVSSRYSVAICLVFAFLVSGGKLCLLSTRYYLLVSLYSILSTSICIPMRTSDISTRSVHWRPHRLLDTSRVQWPVDQVRGPVLLGEKHVLRAFDREPPQSRRQRRPGDHILPVDTNHPRLPGLPLSHPWTSLEGIDSQSCLGADVLL